MSKEGKYTCKLLLGKLISISKKEQWRVGGVGIRHRVVRVVWRLRECFLECGIPGRERKMRDDETGTASECLENCKRGQYGHEGQSKDDEGPDKIEING